MPSRRDSSHPFGRVVLLAFVATSWSLAAHAVPLSQATSTITVNCRAISGGTTHVAVPAAASLACDEVTDFGTEGSFQGVVSAHTAFNPIPLADIQASASYQLGGRGGGGTSSGQAEIQYALRIQSRSPPPALVFQLPVRMHLLADGEASNFARASALVVVQNVLNRSFQTPASGGGSFGIDSVQTLSLFPDLAYTVYKGASCSASARVNAFVNIPSSDCQSVIDPLFELDQAAFDLEMGTSSFPLADYFVLEQSPNMLVPEPSGLVLLGAGLGALLAIRRRHRRS